MQAPEEIAVTSGNDQAPLRIDGMAILTQKHMFYLDLKGETPDCPGVPLSSTLTHNQTQYSPFAPTKQGNWAICHG